jgi:1-acyl-sn-glycerol-3-phosphate acyltransferase
MHRLEEAIEQGSDRLIAEFSGRPYTPSQLVRRSKGETKPAPSVGSATFA